MREPRKGVGIELDDAERAELTDAGGHAIQLIVLKVELLELAKLN